MMIDLLKENEISAISEIEHECFSHPWSEQSIRDSFKNHDAHFFVARENEKIIGYISSEIILDEGYIMNIAVKPEFQGRGVGKALVRYMVDNYKNVLKFITLEVRKSNIAAISLYKKLGFEHVGTRKGYYRNPTEDALLLKLNF